MNAGRDTPEIDFSNPDDTLAIRGPYEDDKVLNADDQETSFLDGPIEWVRKHLEDLSERPSTQDVSFDLDVYKLSSSPKIKIRQLLDVLFDGAVSGVTIHINMYDSDYAEVRTLAANCVRHIDQKKKAVVDDGGTNPPIEINHIQGRRE